MTVEGASPSEQIIEAVRRNNVDLLQEVIEALGPEERAKVINESRDPLGNSPLHVGALNGSYEALDYILDQEGVEVDPVNRIEKDTPLHSVVRYSADEPEHGTYFADMLVDAGCDPRIRNKNGLKPIDICDKDNVELNNLLRSAEYAMIVGPTTKEEDESQGGEEGSGSESE